MCIYRKCNPKGSVRNLNASVGNQPNGISPLLLIPLYTLQLGKITLFNYDFILSKLKVQVKLYEHFQSLCLPAILNNFDSFYKTTVALVIITGFHTRHPLLKSQGSAVKMLL